MPFTIIRQDITKMKVDAIVNAANTNLRMGGGVCGAIFNAAGPEKLQAACDKKAPIQTGEAVITPGFALPAKYIIHTAGPVYHQWTPKESEQLLRSAYTESLKLAKKKNCESIAFPLISSGIYGYPKAEALRVATDAIRDFLDQEEMDVYLAVFDRKALEVSEDLMGRVESYIDQHYTDTHQIRRRPDWEGHFNQPMDMESMALPDAAQMESPRASKSSMGGGLFNKKIQKESGKSSSEPFDRLMDRLDEPFNEALLRTIDRKGLTDAEVYKKANIDRKLFSKIRKGNGYMPGKKTILALSIALELTLEETDDLLERAGYALSHSQKFDVIVEYFIINGQYDIFEINNVLFKYDQPLLGAG